MRLILLAALVASMAPPAAAQNALVDEGTLVVTRAGAVIGRESFRIVQGAGASRVLTATAQASYGARRLTPTLSVDTAGTPLLYRLESREGSSLQERLQATARPGRLSVMLQTASGESARDYVPAGASLVLDDELHHHHAFVGAAARGGARSVTVVVPRSTRQLLGQLSAGVPDSLEIDRRTIAATRYTLTLPDDVREVWLDGRGRLLKVTLRSGQLAAIREEAPR